MANNSQDSSDTTLLIGELRFRLRIAGTGEPIVVLHGFPDSRLLWRHITPPLVAAGYQVIAPDLRGFGTSDAPAEVKQYALHLIIEDVIGMLDALGIAKARLVGHDWGAVVGWLLAAHHPQRVESLVAVSVGHPNAYARGGFKQKCKGWYALMFQLRGVAERLIQANDWWLVRKAEPRHSRTEPWIVDLSRPGRLTAALNWYRANFGRLVRGKEPAVTIPVMGIWSSRDPALTERQMVRSASYVHAPWRYERLDNVGHWIPLDAPDKLVQRLLDFYRG